MFAAPSRRHVKTPYNHENEQAAGGGGSGGGGSGGGGSGGGCGGGDRGGGGGDRGVGVGGLHGKLITLLFRFYQDARVQNL
ncbi:hypothetical protein C0Q70_01094 [Pomacea canaliculata]|uniref:Uncharacterized protein n=1 Tax=Pomacea canaliculata TaxID=400727 RepID=A0A2T7PYJ6_POMCA|nr:hypothetical protein C0Q70_01094 [Pomacea canaliculata]